MNRLGTMIFALASTLFAQSVHAEWTPAKRLSWTSGGSYRPAIVADASGGLHVAWYDYGETANQEIFYIRSTDGGSTWQPRQRLTWTEGGSFNPALAVDLSDNIHLIWEDSPSGMRDIFYRKSTDGGTTWTAGQRLTWTFGTSSNPDIAVDPSGHLHVAWYDSTPGNPEIYYKRSTDGGASWETNKRLTWTSAYSRYPALAADASGHLHLVYEDLSSGYSDAYYKKSTNGGTTWSASRRITWTSSNYFEPDMAVDSSNNPHAVWNAGPPGNEEVYYRKSTDGGTTWTASQLLSLNSGGSYYPAITTGPSNNLQLVWFDYTPGNAEIFYKKSTAGGDAWTSNQRITWTSGNSMTPAIAVDAWGIIHVVWTDNTPGNEEIFYKKYMHL